MLPFTTENIVTQACDTLEDTAPFGVSWKFPPARTTVSAWVVLFERVRITRSDPIFPWEEDDPEESPALCFLSPFYRGGETITSFPRHKTGNVRAETGVSGGPTDQDRSLQLDAEASTADLCRTFLVALAPFSLAKSAPIYRNGPFRASEETRIFLVMDRAKERGNHPFLFVLGPTFYHTHRVITHCRTAGGNPRQLFLFLGFGRVFPTKETFCILDTTGNSRFGTDTTEFSSVQPASSMPSPRKPGGVAHKERKRTLGPFPWGCKQWGLQLR